MLVETIYRCRISIDVRLYRVDFAIFVGIKLWVISNIGEVLSN